MKKEVIRKVLFACMYFFIIVSNVILIVFGKASTFNKVTFSIFLVLWAVERSRLKVDSIKSYKIFLETYKNLKFVHKIRYKACFMDDTQELVEKMTNDIEKTGKDLIEYGKILMSDKHLSQKRKTKVKEIMMQVEHLMTTFQPEMEPHN